MFPPLPVLADEQRSQALPSLEELRGIRRPTTLAQVLLLRELLVLFYGNEMSTALALAGWLLWTSLGSGLAARWAGSRPPRAST